MWGWRFKEIWLNAYVSLKNEAVRDKKCPTYRSRAKVIRREYMNNALNGKDYKFFPFINTMDLTFETL
jgi:hypothetical protein